jgi:hypothetical protein
LLLPEASGRLGSSQLASLIQKLISSTLQLPISALHSTIMKPTRRELIYDNASLASAAGGPPEGQGHNPPIASPFLSRNWFTWPGDKCKPALEISPSPLQSFSRVGVDGEFMHQDSGRQIIYAGSSLMSRFAYSPCHSLQSFRVIIVIIISSSSSILITCY